MGIKDVINAIPEEDFDQWARTHAPELFAAIIDSETTELLTTVQGIDPSATVSDIESGALSALTGGGMPATEDYADNASRPPMVFADVQSQNINDTGNVTFAASTRADSGWSHSTGSNSFSFSGSPDRVRVDVMVSAQIANNVSGQRPAAVIELRKSGVVVCSSRTGYIRDSTDHEESSHTIVFCDPSPGSNPSYTMTSRRDSTNSTTVTSVLGHFSAEAVL
ncbi:MAG: hypothetical protein AAGJ40_09645 [Planctomycetota bacterium]